MKCKRKRKKNNSKSKVKTVDQVTQDKIVATSDKNNDYRVDNEDELWYIRKFFTLEELQNEYVTMCDNEDCQLHAWMLFEGVDSGKNWRTCIDCMMIDYDEWPSIEKCKEIDCQLPISSELEVFVRQHCTNEPHILFPPYICENKEINNFNDTNNTPRNQLNNDIPPLLNDIAIENNTNETIHLNTDAHNDNINSSNNINIDQDSTNRSTAIETNEIEDVSPGKICTVIKRNRPIKFGTEFTTLVEKGLINLRPEVIDKKTNQPCKYGLFVQCIPCRNHKFHNEGIVRLRRPFYFYYYKQHCETESHKEALSIADSIKKQKEKGTFKTYSQTMLHSYFSIKPKKDKNQKDLVSKEIVPNIDTECEVTTITPIVKDNELDGPLISDNKNRKRACVGIVNSVNGKKRNQVQEVHLYHRCDPSSSYKWEYFQGLPALFSVSCDGHGTLKAIDGGLSCLNCILLRRKPGNSNPIRWISKCFEELTRIKARRARKVLTQADYLDLKNVMHRPKISERCTQLGLKLYEENKNQYQYLKQMIFLRKQLDSVPNYDFEKPIDSTTVFFEKAATMYKNNPKFRNSVVVSMLKGIIAKSSYNKNNIQLEEKMVDFYRYLRTLSPKACQFVAANLGLDTKGISDRWLRKLNAKDRGDSVYRSDDDTIYKSIKKMITDRCKEKKGMTFSVAIDATKVPASLNINTARKCIMGGAFPQHMIATQHLGKEEINVILKNDKDKNNNRPITYAQEVKIACICFQNVTPGTSPMQVIAARPQTINEATKFTNDICKACKKITEEVEGTKFANFSTDGVSVESNDIMTTLCEFLDGKINYCATVDNKHNIKNDRYQIIGGSNVACLGNYFIDTHILVEAKISKEIICPKDFASDKKVAELFSYNTLSKIILGIEEGFVKAYVSEIGVLFSTFYMMKLHLYAVNAMHVPAKHRAMYLCISMIWFTSISGVHNIPKRNIILETIGNIFLVLRSDVSKIRHTTSELCEHTFGNTRQEQREFTCSEFSNLMDKQNRRFNVGFRSNLKTSREDNVKGYQETLDEFLCSSYESEDFIGPCCLNMESSVPFAFQLWEHVRKTLHACSDKMLNIFDLLEIPASEISKLHQKQNTIMDLRRQIISICPKSFTYNNMSGESEEMALTVDDEADDEEKNNEESMFLTMEKFTKDINNLSMKDNMIEIDDDIDELEDDSKQINNTVNLLNEEETVKKNQPSVDSSRVKVLKEKAEFYASRNKLIMENTMNILACTDINQLPNISINAMKSLENLERGSLSDDTKAKSLQGRWFSKSEPIMEKDVLILIDTKSKEKKDDIFIERNRLITCMTKITSMEGSKKIVKQVEKKYRVLVIYTKQCNKWFMTDVKQLWSKTMKEEELKKYKCAVRMVCDGAVEDYEDVQFNCGDYDRSELCKLIYGSDIVAVHDELFYY